MLNSRHKKIIDHFKINDPTLHVFLKDLNFDQWLKPKRKAGIKDGYFLALCREIVGQQLSGKAANSIWKRFADLLDSKTITPRKILAVDDQTLRNVGISWAKVKYIKNLAKKITTGELILKDLDNIDDSQIVKRLITVKGIGSWTAEMFLIFTLNRENVFSFGDLGLKKGIEKIYKIKNPTTKQIEKIIRPWEPYKTYGSIALWRSLEI